MGSWAHNASAFQWYKQSGNFSESTRKPVPRLAVEAPGGLETGHLGAPVHSDSSSSITAAGCSAGPRGTRPDAPREGGKLDLLNFKCWLVNQEGGIPFGGRPEPVGCQSVTCALQVLLLPCCPSFVCRPWSSSSPTRCPFTDSQLGSAYPPADPLLGLSVSFLGSHPSLQTAVPSLLSPHRSKVSKAQLFLGCPHPPA